MPASPGSRALRLAAVAFGFGLLLAFVPLPALEFTTASVGATEALPGPQPISPPERAAAQAAADRPLSGGRVVSTDGATDRFTAIGFTFDRQPTQPVLVRVKDASGAFGPWKQLDAEDAEGPDRGSPEGRAARSGTEPFWVGGSTGYEVTMAPQDAARAEVVTVHDVQRRSVVHAEPVAGAATPPPFGINLRAAWGARPPVSTSYGSTVKLAVVHHSASSNSYSPADVPGILRSIQAYHMDGRGWSDIAYNFVVDKYGGIWEGRAGGIDQPVIGAHALGFNTNTVGVMVIGDYTQTGPTAAALESVSRVVGWKLAINGVDPTGRVDYTSGGSLSIPAGVTVNLPRVVGHQDVGSTDCPGSIEASLGSIRARAQDWTNFVRAVSQPVGSLDSLTGGSGQVTATGWAKDPTTSTPPAVRLTAGAVTVAGTANLPRPDVAAVYPDYGPSTGYNLTASGVAPGMQLACVAALDADGGSDALLGCARVLVADPSGLSPTGHIAGVAGGTGRIRVVASTADVDGPAPRTVTLRVDGVVRSQLLTRSDGTFDATITGVVAGRREVCVDVANRGGGVDVTADCANVDVAGASPSGNVDGFVLQGNFVELSGWADDPESDDPLPVDVVLDGTRVFRAANGRPRPDVAAATGAGGNSGFVQQLWNVGAGQHTLCAVARNVGAGADQTVGCRRFVVK